MFEDACMKAALTTKSVVQFPLLKVQRAPMTIARNLITIAPRLKNVDRPIPISASFLFKLRL